LCNIITKQKFPKTPNKDFEKKEKNKNIKPKKQQKYKNTLRTTDNSIIINTK
jgi:hypothetical protein